MGPQRGNHISRYGYALARSDADKKSLKRVYEFGTPSTQTMTSSYLLDEVNRTMIKDGGMREVLLIKSRIKSEEFINKIKNDILSPSDVEAVIDDLRVWLSKCISKMDNLRLALVNCSYVFAYGDVAESGESFRDALIEYKLKGCEEADWLAILKDKNYTDGITHRSITDFINEIEKKRINIKSVGIKRELICRFGNNCKFSECRRIHNDRWSPEVAKKNAKKFSAGGKKPWEDRKDKKKKKKGSD